MKRLIIPLLVLAMASSAHAAQLELSVDGSRDGVGNTTEITIDVDSTITIDVYCNTAAPAPDTFYLAIVEDTGDGEWVESSVVIYDAMGDTGTLTKTTYSDDWYFGTTGIYIPEPPPGPGTWCTLVFHCESIGDVYIHLTDSSGAVSEDLVLVHQIPEPMSIILLGLGGLFLHRRK